jgi:hypothetical protein
MGVGVGEALPLGASLQQVHLQRFLQPRYRSCWCEMYNVAPSMLHECHHVG